MSSQSDLDHLRNTVGQVVTTIDGRVGSGKMLVDGFSTGFIFSDGHRLLFITTNHALRDIHRKYGSAHPVFAAFPPRDSNSTHQILGLRLIAQEPAEDAAVFEFTDAGGALPATKRLSPSSVREGQELIYIAASPTRSGHTLCQSKVIAAVIPKSDGLVSRVAFGSIPTDGFVEFFGSGDISEPGMSGSPAFDAQTHEFVGMVIAFGDDQKDPEVAAAFGVKQFNIITPLSKTFSRLADKK